MYGTSISLNVFLIIIFLEPDCRLLLFNHIHSDSIWTAVENRQMPNVHGSGCVAFFQWAETLTKIYHHSLMAHFISLSKCITLCYLGSIGMTFDSSVSSTGHSNGSWSEMFLQKHNIFFRVRVSILRPILLLFTLAKVAVIERPLYEHLNSKEANKTSKLGDSFRSFPFPNHRCPVSSNYYLLVLTIKPKSSVSSCIK